MKTQRYSLLSIVLCFLTVALSGCDPGKTPESSERENGTPDAEKLLIYYVGVAGPADLFHGTIARGAEQAAKDLGVRVVYIFPDKLTLPQYIEKLEQAIAAQPDGLVVMGIDEKGTEPVVQRAHDLGITLAFNPAPPVGERPTRDPNDLYISRVGSDEYSAGVAVAKRLLEDGLTRSVLCGVHVPGDGTLMMRAKGIEETLGQSGIETDVREIPFEPGQCEEFLTNYLRTHPDLGAIVTLDSRLSPAARAAKRTLGREDLLLAGFDLDLPTLQGIKSGEVLFTVDQQQFWRGYIPVLEITHHLRYGLTQANYFLSGPNIVDRENVDQVLELVEKGYR